MRSLFQVTALIALLGLAGWLTAQEGAGRPGARNSAPARGSGAKAKVQAPITITPEREAAVMTFIERNHPELGDLLAHLKDNQPEAYEQAVKDLFRTTERLASIKERDPAQYDLEVVLWKAQSRVQLLTAKLKMAVTEDLKKELRAALGEQTDARLALTKHERMKAAARVSKLDDDIARFSTERERVIDRQLEILTRSSEGRGAKAGAKAAAKSNAKKAVQPTKTVTP